MTAKQREVTFGEMAFTLFIGLLLLAFLAGSLDFSPRARIAPLGVSLLGLLLITIDIVRLYPHFRKSDKRKQPTPDSFNKTLIYLIFLVSAYPLMTWIAGYLVSSLLLVFAGLSILKFPRKKWNIFIAAGFSSIMYFIFRYLLQVQLPGGFLGIG